MWKTKLTEIPLIKNLNSLPVYGFQFFFRNIGQFQTIFILLTVCAVFSALLRFSTVFIIGHIVSHIDTLLLNTIFTAYIPLWVSAVILAEILDFFIRRYSEALPLVYAEYTQLRFYRSFLELPSYRLYNFSKERLISLVTKYIAHVQTFLTNWIWDTTFKITRLCIILCILAYQDWRILLANLIYIVFFLLISFRISSRFSVVASAFTERSLESSTAYSGFLFHLNTVKRLGAIHFVLNRLSRLVLNNWSAFDRVRQFHAWRWFFQLHLFNLLYITTLALALYQIKQGQLALGFLVLVMWAFNELWNVLVYFIEYYVSLVQQREETKIIQRELCQIIDSDLSRDPADPNLLSSWSSLALNNITVTFDGSRQGESPFSLHVPQLTVARGEKIGIIGESGAGKSTLLNVFLNFIPFSGSYTLNNNSVKNQDIPPTHIALTTSSDPLFKLSLIDNILLGRNVPTDHSNRVLEGLLITEFAANTDKVIGDPNCNLSAGQEQRIRLARGLLQESSIYLFDEPFNGIDPAKKVTIIKFISEYLKDKTVILITHVKEELSLVDRIYEIRDGVLKEVATTGGES